MEQRKFILKETGIVALGVGICVAVMVGVFDWKVPVGGIIGGVLAVANFLFMAIGASLAADKAQEQDVKGGQTLIRNSYMLRLAVLFIVLFVECGLRHDESSFRML